ncbi:MAG: hypothetical protein K0Q99_1351 [Clostridia bacterium]|jgi:hypothetical protein|nr:hypothetical protein [Clostridia bacterium]
MPYGKSGDIGNIKKKIEEKMPGVDIDNLSKNDMQKMLMNEINKDNSIDPSVKEKINKGDIEGLKQDLIGYLSRSKGGDSEKLVKMLKDNDMDGLKNQLMGMLMGGLNTQKKNEITDEGDLDGIGTPQASTPPTLDNNIFLNSIMGKMFEGSKSDNRVMFLNSMKPFVSEKRQKSIDDCVKILSALSVFDRFNNKAES